MKKPLIVSGVLAIAALAFFTTRQTSQRSDLQANSETIETTNNSPEENELPLCHEVPWIGEVQESAGTPGEESGELQWAIPLGFLAGEFQFLPTTERYQNRVEPTGVTEIGLYDEPGGSELQKAYLYACHDYVNNAFRLSLDPPNEGTTETGTYDLIWTGYKFQVGNLTYYQHDDGYLNILRNSHPGGFWVKEDDIDGFFAPTPFGEYMTRFRTWRIFGYHRDNLRSNPSDDAEVVLFLDESRHVVWGYTGEFTDRWAEVVIYEVSAENLDGCYADEEVLANRNGNQWTGWLRVFGEGGQFSPHFFMSSEQGVDFPENVGVHNSY